VTQLYVIGEDALCCALGERLTRRVLGWTLAQPPVDAKGVTRLQGHLGRYAGLAHVHPVLCVADADHHCPVDWVRRWKPKHASERFLLRLAVTEAESWLLADAEGLAAFLKIPKVRIASRPDELRDPKREVLHLASQSRERLIRQEVVSAFDRSKAGTGYNAHLCNFVRQHWDPLRAMSCSPSLARAVRSLQSLGG
jgi:hypothetical protein